MPSKDEPEREVKQSVPYPVRKKQSSEKWNKTNHGEEGRTSAAWNETIQIIPNNDEPVREVKPCKTCLLMMNQWGMQNNTNNAQNAWTYEAWTETIQIMHNNDEAVGEVKEYKTCPVMMNEQGNEAKPTMLSNAEPVRDAKQYKPWPIKMKQR
jgi:hypothetical protein